MRWPTPNTFAASRLPTPGPRTAIGSAADRLRIENIEKLTRRIGDQATYLTRGIAGAWCLVSDALNPTYQPPSMAFSKQKEQVLRGLASGRKLREFIREAGMPPKAMLEEWRSHDAEFEAAYTEAEEAGRVRRGEPAPAKPKAVPTVTDQDGREHAIPRSTALQAAPEATPRHVNSKAESLAIARAAKATKRSQEAVGVALPVAAAAEATAPNWPTEYAELAMQHGLLRQDYGHRLALLQEEIDAAGREKTQLLEETYRWSEAEQHEKVRHQAEVDALVRQLTDYQEYQADQKRLTRELDMALFGENAAEQAALCDLVKPAKALADCLRKLLIQQAEQASAPAPACDLTPSHPGILLARMLREMHTPQVKLAQALSLAPTQLSKILKGKRPVHLALCLRLENLCWGTAENWAQHQLYYDMYQERQKIDA